MARDVTHLVADLGTTHVLFGITFEQLVLILYPLFLIPIIYFWYYDVRRRRFLSLVPTGCTKLGLQGESNNTDELDSKYDRGTKDQQMWQVKTIYIHPIKSCAPIELDIADVDAEGLTYDRKFAFAELLKPSVFNPSLSAQDTKPKWTFRTLRQPGYEKLALVKPEIWIPRNAEAEAAGSLRRVEQEGALIIKYPNVPTGVLAPLDRLMMSLGLIPKDNSFRVPLNVRRDHKYPREVVNIWKDDPIWINLGEHVPEDFKQWLGVKNPLSLFRVDPENYRHVFRCAPKREDVGFQPAVGFQDAYPLHMLNIASVHDVGSKVGNAISGLSVRRFRGNLILEGPPAYDEDDWKKIKIGDHELYCTCHTLRCRVSKFSFNWVWLTGCSCPTSILIQLCDILPNQTRH